MISKDFVLKLPNLKSFVCSDQVRDINLCIVLYEILTPLMHFQFFSFNPQFLN